MAGTMYLGTTGVTAGGGMVGRADFSLSENDLGISVGRKRIFTFNL